MQCNLKLRNNLDEGHAVCAGQIGTGHNGLSIEVAVYCLAVADVDRNVVQTAAKLRNNLDEGHAVCAGQIGTGHNGLSIEVAVYCLAVADVDRNVVQTAATLIIVNQVAGHRSVSDLAILQVLIRPYHTCSDARLIEGICDHLCALPAVGHTHEAQSRIGNVLVELVVLTCRLCRSFRLYRRFRNNGCFGYDRCFRLYRFCSLRHHRGFRHCFGLYCFFRSRRHDRFSFRLNCGVCGFRCKFPVPRVLSAVQVL